MKQFGVFLALLLRHKPEVIGLQLVEHGWANVDELICKVNSNSEYTINMAELEEVVRTDNKQRYSFNDDKTLIRANQGHSIKVDVELKKRVPPDTLYHGTAERFVQSILKNGLTPQSRLYVHLSKDIETATKVGSRHGKPYIFKVDTGKMGKLGYEFFLSENGVWLTKSVPTEFLQKAE